MYESITKNMIRGIKEVRVLNRAVLIQIGGEKIGYGGTKEADYYPGPLEHIVGFLGHCSDFSSHRRGWG